MSLYQIAVISSFLGDLEDVDHVTKSRGIIDCLTGYTLQKKLSVTRNRVIFQGHKNGQQKPIYALKFIGKCPQQPSEIYYSRLLSEYGIGPKFIDFKVIPDIGLGLIVTETWDGPLWDEMNPIDICPPDEIVSNIKKQISDYISVCIYINIGLKI